MLGFFLSILRFFIFSTVDLTECELLPLDRLEQTSSYYLESLCFVCNFSALSSLHKLSYSCRERARDWLEAVPGRMLAFPSNTSFFV